VPSVTMKPNIQGLVFTAEITEVVLPP
jgi:hypothetical protein